MDLEQNEDDKSLQLPDLGTSMQEAMAKLEARNNELDGELCFKVGDPENFPFAPILIFPTSITEQIPQSEGGSVTAEQYLLATGSGFKLIQVVSSSQGEEADRQVLAKVLDDLRNADKETIFYDDKLNGLMFSVRRSYSQKGYTIGKTGSTFTDTDPIDRGNGRVDHDNIFIKDINSPDDVLKIIKVNVDRVKSDRESKAMKQGEDGEKIKPSIVAAQRLDKVLE